MDSTHIEEFTRLVATVTDRIGQQPLDAALEAVLNREFPAGGEVFEKISQACQAAIEAGWMCQHEGGGIRYGRVAKPAAALNGFSIDVVLMENLEGPHHRHPHGEIDMIMPIDDEAKFDGRGRGWLVYPADHAHHPTVTGGRAVVLYLLPEGAIEFTKAGKGY